MRRRYIAVALLMLAGVVSAPADLLWDNFLTKSAGGFDGETYFTCERDSIIPDSWAIDDMTLESVVQVDALRWAGGYYPGYAYTVEVLVLDENLQNIAPGLGPYDPTYVLDTWQLEGTYGSRWGYTLYNGTVALPAVQLDPGQYYVGVRLVSSGNGSGPGRNVALSTGSGPPPEGAQAMVQIPLFGYSTWTPVDDLPGEEPTDIAFQVYGAIVPEPLAVGLLALGLLLRRR